MQDELSQLSGINDNSEETIETKEEETSEEETSEDNSVEEGQETTEEEWESKTEKKIKKLLLSLPEGLMNNSKEIISYFNEFEIVLS